MPDPSALVVFGAAAIVLLVIPGPAVLYIVARSAAQGRRAGLASVAGVHTGTMVHIAAALVGLSAVIAASATAFAVVKLAGAAYLVWLGVRALLGNGEDVDVTVAPPPVRSLRRIYTDGVVLNVLNPKTAVFFLAFVPQFVDRSAGQVNLQLVELGALFIALGLASDSVYALAAARVGSRLRRTAAAARRTRRLTGTVYIGLGVVTALSGGPAD